MNLARHLADWGLALVESGRTREAEAPLREALDLYGELPPGHPFRGRVESHLGAASRRRAMRRGRAATPAGLRGVCVRPPAPAPPRFSPGDVAIPGADRRPIPGVGGSEPFRRLAQSRPVRRHLPARSVRTLINFGRGAQFRSRRCLWSRGHVAPQRPRWVAAGMDPTLVASDRLREDHDEALHASIS